MRRIEEQGRPIGGGRAPRGARAAVLFVPRPSVWRREGAPGGLALLDRQLKQLRKLEIDDVTLLVPAHDPSPVVTAPGPTPRVVRVPTTACDLPSALVAVADDLADQCLALAGDHLVDLRVLRALAERDATTFASVEGTRVDVGLVRARDVRGQDLELVAHADRLLLATLDAYSPELRGVAVPYAFPVVTDADHARAWDVLLDHVQKRALDLPGQYFDTPFENALVRRFAPTTVTPNQITFATLVLAVFVAWLFAHGWLRVGVVLALVVGVLDGVDGKLARMKLATSKIGELEHVGDFLYENAWYLSLAAYFAAATQSPVFWYAGWLLVVSDLADSLLYLAAQRRTGRMLDELTPFDRRFRAIAGRRNVYVMIFVVGFSFGDAERAFLVAVGWAVTTVAVHAFRVATVARHVPVG